MKNLKLLAFLTTSQLFYFNLSYSQNAIDSLKNLSDSNYYAQNFPEALRIAWLLEKEVKQDSSENCREYAIATGMYLAMNYEKLKKYDSAALWYQNSIDKFRTLGDTLNISYGETLASTGNFYWERSIYEQAIVLLRKAILVLKDADPSMTEGEGAALNNLANCYKTLGIINRAEQMYLSSLNWIKNKMPEVAEKKMHYVYVYNNLAALYEDMGNVEKASQYADSTLKLYKFLPNQDENTLALLLSNRSALYNSCNNADSGLSFARKAIFLFEKNSSYDNPAYFSATNNLANGYLMKKKKDSAELFTIHACQLAKKYNGELSNEYLSYSLNLCNFFSQQEKFYKSDSVLQSIYPIIQQIFGPYAEQTIKATNLFASMQLRKGMYKESAETLKMLSGRITDIVNSHLSGLSENQKLFYLNTLNKSIGLFGELAMKFSNSHEFPMQEFFQQQITIKRLILGQQQELMRLLQLDNSEKASTILLKWKREKQLLAVQILSNKQQNNIKIDSLEKVIELTEKEIHLMYPNIAVESFKSKNATDEISKALNAGETAIEFINFDLNTNKTKKNNFYAALLVQPGISKPLFVPLFNEEKLLLFIGKEGTKNIIKGELVSEIYSISLDKNQTSLYTLIWKPLEKYLSPGKLVYYSPAGLLNTIAMHAIPIGPNKFLCDKYHLRCVSNINNVTAQLFKNSSPPGRISLWGDFNYDLYKNRTSPFTGINKKVSRSKQNDGNFKLESIPYSKIEVESIDELFKKRGLSSILKQQSEATEDMFKQKINGVNGVLHISTHGFFTELRKSYTTILTDKTKKRSAINILSEQRNPLFRCGLAFSGVNYVYDGNKPLNDIDDAILTGYEISQLNLQHIQLVSLSACKTGVGDINGNEGVFGLQRAFFIAGANKILMSLWPVPDKETSDLMPLFYNNWLKGATIYEALNLAREKVRKKYPHPFYWAGFVLME